MLLDQEEIRGLQKYVKKEKFFVVTEYLLLKYFQIHCE
jgi:hypothetical protein